MRLNARFKLFTLRDELRSLKLEQASRLDDELFARLDSTMNTLLDRLSSITISAIAEVDRAAEKDAAFRKYVAERDLAIKSCGIPRIISIDDECQQIFMTVFLANAGGWIVYVIPIALFATLYQKISTGIKSLRYANSAFQDTILPPAHASA